jgi:hypothetical protein
MSIIFLNNVPKSLNLRRAQEQLMYVRNLDEKTEKKQKELEISGIVGTLSILISEIDIIKNKLNI